MLPNTEHHILDSVRTDAKSLHDEAISAVQIVLESIGIGTHIAADGVHHDLIADGPMGAIQIEVKAMAVADPTRLTQRIQFERDKTSRQPAANRVVLLVADQIPLASKDLLRDDSWSYLDRRGHLWFTADGIRINDTELAPIPRDSVTTRPGPPINGRIGLGMGLHLLMHPTQPVGVRELSRKLRCSTSSAHAAFTRLRNAALIEADGTPLIPELFWATADVWHPNRRPVAREPMPGEFDVGINAGSASGWAVGGGVAAAAWGARIVVGSADPPDLYVPNSAALRLAARRLGETTWAQRAATIAVAPVAAVTMEQNMTQLSMATPSLHWPLAHPVVVALDLAQDKSRGREILEEWSAPDGYTRVW